MAALTPTPKMQFFTANGDPLVGGKLYTYTAGTNNPLPTYTDQGGLTANTNPVIMDSRGEASVWLGGGVYKFVLKDSLDTLIWTADNIVGIDTNANAALVSFQVALAASGGSELIGYLPSGTGAVATTVQTKLRESVSVKDFGAVGDGVTDDSAAIQAAVTEVIVVNSGQLYFPSGTYKITSALTVPFSTGWRIFGASRGSVAINQFTANTPIFALTGDLTHSWEISDIGFTWNAANPIANTNAIAVKMATGTATGNGFFNFQIRRCTFTNGFRAIAGDSTNSPAVWGVHISDCVFGGSMSGAAFYAVPSPAVGQPNICIENSLIGCSGMGEKMVQISSGDNVVLRNVEFLDGSTSAVLEISSTPSVCLIGCKSEAYAFGASSNSLFSFPGSYATLINCSVNGFTGTANPVLFNATSSGKLALIGVYATSSMTGGTAVLYSASDIVSAINIKLVGLVTDDVRSILGNVAVPRLSSDNKAYDYVTVRGDVALTMVATDDAIQSFNTTLTANRTVTLPSTGLVKGLEFHIVRRATTPGAFTLTVSDPLSGVNYTIPANTNGWARYRAASTGQWYLIGAGTF